jgi:hypothetical protein
VSGHHGDLPDNCKFGHVFQIMNEDKNGAASSWTPPMSDEDIIEKIEDGTINDLDDVEEEIETDFLRPIMGEPFKNVKVSSGSQGTPYTWILVAADTWDEDLDYEVAKTMEKIHISPQNTMHDEFMQRKRQAEQRVNQTLGSLSDLRKQKHMLEHDIRKLRTRVEALREGDETQLKSDFVQLVDGAGAGGQGADEQAMRFLRDNDIYPTIVADFNEMDSLKDLKPKDNEGTGKLANLPANEKAILKKKFTMYEKWKDLYGSEVQRKLNELKSQLRNIESSLEQTKEWLQPYVRDITMINQKSQSELGDDITKYMAFQGYATQFKDIEFICHKGLKNEEGTLIEAEDGDEPTHYKIMYIHAVHVNIAGGENPNSPSQGPTAGVVFWFPAIVCKHVFEHIFKEKIEKSADEFEELMQDYVGDFKSTDGTNLKRNREDKEISIHELREKVKEKLEEMAEDDDDVDTHVDIEFSATIRRVEDGFEDPAHITDQYSKNHLKAIDEILDTGFAEDEEDEENEMLSGFNKKLQMFTGNYGDFYVDSDDPLMELKNEFKFNYYYDLKLDFGLHTMK